MDSDYNVSSGPFFNYEIEIGDELGPELDKNVMYLLCPVLEGK